MGATMGGWILVLLALFSVTLGYKKDGKCYKPVNLAIIIDASGSIEPSDWSAEISAAKSIVETIAKASTENKFAIIEFSTDATLMQQFDNDASKAQTVLDTMKENFKDGHSFIDAALNEAVKLFQANPAAKGSMDVVLIITDGYMTFRDGKDNTEFLKIPKDKLTAAKVKTFSIGIGDYKAQTLEYISSEPSNTHVTKITEYQNMPVELQKSAETTCPAADQPLKCGKVLFSKAGVGCYKDLKNVLPLPELILTDRDSSSRAYSGQTIDWNNWDTYMQDFICRCAEKASEMKRTIFGLENYGECWSSDKTDTYDKDGPAAAGQCKTLAYKPCTATDKQCVGVANTLYVYKIQESAS